MYVGKLLLFSMLVTIEGLVLNNLVNSMFPLAIDVPRYLTPNPTTIFTFLHLSANHTSKRYILTHLLGTFTLYMN